MRIVLTDGVITLRPPGPGDEDAIYAACQDPEIQRWTGVPSPYLREHSSGYLERVAAEREAGTSLAFLAVDEEGALLGNFSVMELDRRPGYGEIGYWVAAPARGRGVATRATRLLTEWGHAELGLERIEIIVHRDNAPSHRVPERLGYERLPGLHPLTRLGDPDPVFVRYVSLGTKA